jgi:hypothetical protein
MKYRVTYWTKCIEEKNKGFLVESHRTFKDDNEAIEFIKNIRMSYELVTSPLLEVI